MKREGKNTKMQQCGSGQKKILNTKKQEQV